MKYPLGAAVALLVGIASGQPYDHLTNAPDSPMDAPAPACARNEPPEATRAQDKPPGLHLRQIGSPKPEETKSSSAGVRGRSHPTPRRDHTEEEDTALG